MQSIGIPEKVLTDLNRLFYKFIWQKRFSNRKAFEKVKKSVMEGNVDEGGLNMVNIVHIQKAFYLQWVAKLTDSSEKNGHIYQDGCSPNWLTAWVSLTSTVPLNT